MRSQRAGKMFAPLWLAALFIACAATCAGRVAAADAPDTRLEAYRQHLAMVLQRSPSPRDWALGSQLLETRLVRGASLRERGLILQKAAKAAPRDRLVQTLWANIPLHEQHCRTTRRCTDHAAALARLDPGNGAAWAAVIDHAWKQGDVRGAEAALRRMAGADRYNEHLGEAVAAWRDVLRRYPPPLPQVLPRHGADTSADILDALDLAFDEAVQTIVPPIPSLFDACRRAKYPNVGARRFQTCGKIARLMMGRSQTLIGRGFGVAILRASHVGTQADIPMVRAVTWQLEQYRPIAATLGSNAVAKQNHLNLIESTDSEMQVIQYELKGGGIALTPPDGWKQTLNGKQIEPLYDLASQVP